VNVLVFLINAFAQLYLFVLLLRFWLPLLRADFRNPIAQGILKLTSPLVVPVRRLVPSVGRVDTATVIVSFAIQYVAILLILTLIKQPANASTIALIAVIDLVVLSLRLFMFAIIVKVVLSWFAPGAYNPATALVQTLSYPVLKPFASLVPRLGGIDISPVIAIILLQAAMIGIGGLRPFAI